jgi:rare lipoprotein A
MVTNLENGRAVEVRVNDRGPFVGGRAIDLSYGAARKIGMIGPGTVRAKVEVLGRAAPAPVRAGAPPPADAPLGSYLVEVAALSDPAKAEHLRRVLARRFPDAFVSPLAGGSGQYYRVRLGPYPLRGIAVARAELVARLGYPAVLVDEPAE